MNNSLINVASNLDPLFLENSLLGADFHTINGSLFFDYPKMLEITHPLQKVNFDSEIKVKEIDKEAVELIELYSDFFNLNRQKNLDIFSVLTQPNQPEFELDFVANSENENDTSVRIMPIQDNISKTSQPRRLMEQNL
ncbi:MAG TPA: hypothetical protein DCF68_21745, partial [Cyanothece sp. UBA12306]|nr:hypothetical protein [Cyanothece sp. UBA12306]